MHVVGSLVLMFSVYSKRLKVLYSVWCGVKFDSYTCYSQHNDDIDSYSGVIFSLI